MVCSSSVSLMGKPVFLNVIKIFVHTCASNITFNQFSPTWLINFTQAVGFVERIITEVSRFMFYPPQGGSINGFLFVALFIVKYL